jgi:hypothetical protein
VREEAVSERNASHSRRIAWNVSGVRSWNGGEEEELWDGTGDGAKFSGFVHEFQSRPQVTVEPLGSTVG